MSPVGRMAPDYTEAFDSIVAKLDPLLWYKMADGSGSSSMADSSGNGHTGTLGHTAVTFGEPAPIASEPADTSALFNSSSVGTGFNQSFSAVSIIALLKANADLSSGFGMVAANAHTDSTKQGLRFGVGGGNADFIASNGSAIQELMLPWPGEGSWHLVTGTADGTQAQLFVDKNTTANAALSGPVPAGSEQFTVGFWAVDVNSFFWPGYMAQFIILPSAITQGIQNELWKATGL